MQMFDRSKAGDTAAGTPADWSDFATERRKLSPRLESCEGVCTCAILAVRLCWAARSCPVREFRVNSG